jgi:hypothetical protein
MGAIRDVASVARKSVVHGVAGAEEFESCQRVHAAPRAVPARPAHLIAPRYLQIPMTQ